MLPAWAEWMIKVNKKELLAAVDKASVKCKDTFILSISDKRNSENKVYATILASDGLAQAITTVLVTAEKPVSFTVGCEFADVLKVLGEFGDEYNISLTDKALELSVGSASMTISLKDDGTKIQMQNPKKDQVLYNATFDRAEFVKAVRQGTFAYCTDGSINIASTAGITSRDKKLYITTTDGKMATRSYAKNILDNDSSELDCISVDAPSLRAICNKLEEDKINVMIFDKQFIIKDGNSYYTIIRYQNQFPKEVNKLLDNVDYNFKAVLDVSSLKAAIKVATILEKDKKAMLQIGEQVTISNVLCSSKAVVKAENIEGAVNVILNSKHIESALQDIGTDKITVYGKGTEAPVYIIADDLRFLTAPFKQN